jgi:hypothetical protein
MSAVGLRTRRVADVHAVIALAQRVRFRQPRWLLRGEPHLGPLAMIEQPHALLFGLLSA